MSIKSMTWAFSQPLSGNEKVVLLALADFADDDGLCWPSIPKIAEKAYLSVRTVQRIILNLSDQSYLSFVKRSADNGRPISSMYQLFVDGDKLTPYGDTGDTTMVTLLSPHKEPSIEPSVKKNNKGGRVPENFRPDASCQAVARELCIHGMAFQNQIDTFLDYWRAVPGAKGLKLDWQATFRNWLRNSKPKTNGIYHAKSHKPTIQDTFAAIDARLDAAQAQLDARIQGSSHQDFDSVS